MLTWESALIIALIAYILGMFTALRLAAGR